MDHWKIFFLSSCGTPISSAIACSGSSQATSVTKSPVPSASAVATIRSARSRRLSRMPRTAFGVKPRDTMPRTLVCSGGSMLSRITRCISIASLVMPSWNRISAVFSQLEYRSLRRETSRMSACLVTAQ